MSVVIRMASVGIVTKTAHGIEACGRETRLPAARTKFLPLAGRLELKVKKSSCKILGCKRHSITKGIIV